MIIWSDDVNGGFQTLSNINIQSITQSWGGNVNGGGNTLSNVIITSLTQSWGGDVTANSHNIGGLRKVSIAILGTTAATGALVSTDPSIILYNSGGNNWAGIGTDPTGNVYIRTGTSGTGRANLIVNANGVVELSNGTTTGITVYGTTEKGLRVTNTGTDYYDIGRRGADGFLAINPSQNTFSGYTLYTKDSGGTLWPRFVIYNSGHVVQGCPNGLVADSQVTTSTMHFAVDEASNTLKVRIRYSNGTTLKTGLISLS